MALMTAAPLMEADDGMDLGVEEVIVTSNGTDASDIIEAEDVDDLVTDMVKKVSAAAADLDDIVILEDDEDMGASHTTGKNTNDLMDIDENELLKCEDKENISKTLKRLSRKELEDLILVKVVEAIVKHSEAGKLRSKVLELQTQKDKMFQRVGGLQKQVQEMSKALKVLIDNHNRDPNGLNPNKRQKTPPIKFYRSVGLQVAIEAPYRNGITKVINVNESPINGFKNINGAVYNVPQSPIPINRTMKSAIAVDVIKQVLPGTASSQVVRILNGQVSKLRGSNVNLMPGVLKNGNGQAAILTSPVKSNSSNVTSPTVVDLTEDSIALSQGSSNGSNVMAVNGVQYRIINPQAQGTQIFHQNQSYQIVTTQSGQVRPILFAHNMSGGQAQGKSLQTVTLRNITPRLTVPTGVIQTRPTMSQMRPITAGPSGPRVAATIGTMVRAPLQPITPKKFTLPPLPASGVVSVPRGRVLKELPPKPGLTLSEQDDGIVLSWTLKLSPQNNAEIASYQIYACQESLTTTPGKVSQWKKVGDVKALPLPMACTLSQFTQGNRYFFIVRGVDTHGRTGSFCEPAPIILYKKN